MRKSSNITILYSEVYCTRYMFLSATFTNVSARHIPGPDALTGRFHFWSFLADSARNRFHLNPSGDCSYPRRSLLGRSSHRRCFYRARERIRTRGFREHAVPNRGKASRGDELVDSEAHQLDAEAGDLLGGTSTNTEGGQDAIATETEFEATQVWHTTARHDPEVRARAARLPQRCI